MGMGMGKGMMGLGWSRGPLVPQRVEVNHLIYESLLFMIWVHGLAELREEWTVIRTQFNPSINQSSMVIRKLEEVGDCGESSQRISSHQGGGWRLIDFL